MYVCGKVFLLLLLLLLLCDFGARDTQSAKKMNLSS
jgi:hypothetical protein